MHRYRWSALLAVGIAMVALPATAGGQQIRWRSVDAAPGPVMTSVEAARALGDLVRPGQVRHVVIQFSRPIDGAARARLDDAGIELLASLGTNAFFAALDDRLDARELGRVRSLKSAHAIERDLKLHPMLVRGEVPEWSIVEHAPDPVVGLYVLFHTDIPREDTVQLVRAHGAEVMARLQSVNGLVIELPVSHIDALADEDAVQWIEPPLPPFSETNDLTRIAVQASNAQAAPYNLDGAGVVAMIYDSGAYAGHPDLIGRLTPRDHPGMWGLHGTHVAGILGGDGTNSAGLYRGMAPGVTMESYIYSASATGIFLYNDPGDLESDYADAINNYGAVLANNSISSAVELGGPCLIQGDYGLTSSIIDAIVRGSLGAPIRVIWGNGNERLGSRCDIEGFGDYYSMAPPACAKNHITVGAINSNDNSVTSFTSWGPCDDGRLKPDIVAPGCITSCAPYSGYGTLCGTSMSTPVVTGLSALLLEDYRNQFPERPDFRPSTLKALLTHNALDLVNPGPDYQTGYGLVQIKDTIDFMRTGRFLEAEVDQGQTFVISVAVADGADALKVTLTWDDVPGTPNVALALVNDLDLLVTGPGGSYLPWTLDPADPGAPAVRTAPDHLNNIEQVLVENPQPGIWTVEVHGFNVPEGPQTFSLAGAGQLSYTVISLPDGAPQAIEAGVQTLMTVRITAVGETVVKGSETCHYRLGKGSFTAEPLTPLGGDLYEAVLPAAPCGAAVEFFFSADGSVSGDTFNPSGAPANTYAPLVGSVVDLFADNLETDRGWTVGAAGDDASTGIWTRVDPIGTLAQPEDDHTEGPGVVCFVTGQGTPGGQLGENDVDGGSTTLIAPPIDLDSADDATISYWRWYSNDTGGSPNADVFIVDISNDDGASWVNVETIGPSGPGTSGGWLFHEFDVADFVAPTSQVRVRFIASDAADGSLVEAAVDDFLVRRFSCDGAAAAGDLDGDGLVGINDFLALLEVWGPCPEPPAPCPADLDGDGQVELADFLILLSNWG